MAECTKFLLFGDETANLHSLLRSLIIDSRANPYLSLFLQSSGNLLRTAINHLPPSERRQIGKFSTIEELNESTDTGRGHVGVECALHCVLNVGQYIKCAGAGLLFGTDVVPVGVALGVFPAAAIAISSDIPTLINVASETTLVAFRAGLHIERTALYLGYRNPESSTPCAIDIPIISQDEARNILDEFITSKSIPTSQKPYISSVIGLTIRISGPPNVLDDLLQFSEVMNGQSIPVPVHGPYHASHLYHGIDYSSFLKDEIVEPSINWASKSTTLDMIFANDGGYCEKGFNGRELMEKILHELFVGNDLIEDMTKEMVRRWGSGENRCGLLSCYPSRLGSSIRELLQTHVEYEIAVEEQLFLGADQSNVGEPNRRSRKPRLAIVGMAGRFPNAADHEKFWDLLAAGMDLHKKVPKDRFDIEKYYDPTGKIRNTSHTPFGCFIDEPGLFDPRFFNMSPREATQTDPMHRLGLTSAYEALEMAGYVPNRTPSTRLDRIGVFYGQTSDDWREINAAQDVDTYFITGGVRAFAPGRINYFFKFTGPSFSIDTACSSSAAAMQLACTSLWASDCDTAVIGGLNVMTNSDIFSGLSRGQFLSKTGNCQTYDNDADGYCRGDGIGSLVIKRLEDAEADNDRILGLIIETETNHSANAISITHPHAETQQDLFQKVMNDAGVDPHDVNYVEMHGTGTQAGDGTEMKSVTSVFAPPSRSGTRRQALHLGSVKANAGHGEAVSGVTAMIKCLLMLQKNLIPPHCGIKTAINQSFPKDLSTRNVHIAFKPTPLASKDGLPRRIFVNNFSAAGGNTATLLEEAPARPIPATDVRGEWVVAISAKSKSSLQKNTKNMIEFLTNNQDTRVADLSYTTTARRIQHNYRIAFNCNNISQAIETLSSKALASIDPVSSIAPNVAFAYTGQGSHYTAVASQLLESSSQFRKDLEMFNGIALDLGFPSFMELVTGKVEASDLSPLIVQIGLACIQMALTRLWAAWGIKPSVVIGHSLGEYAALNAAGALSVSDTIYLVGERAKLLESRCISGSHAMLATKSSAKALRGIFDETSGIEIACINGTNETVLGGTVVNVNEASDKLAIQGIKCTKLNVQFAFHSSQVDPILEDFAEMAAKVVFKKPEIPIISPLLRTVVHEKGDFDGKYLSRHAREPVDFVGGLASAQELGSINEQTVFVEIGAHPVCSNFIKSSLGAETLIAPSLRRGLSPYRVLSESLSLLHLRGLTIDWNETHKDYTHCVRMLDLPAYAFDNKNYWIQYTGDWNLTKGQIQGLAAIPAPEKPKISTTSVQKVLSEVVEDGKATIVIESDVSRPDLYATISGHVVNGTALCPSSLYADMALTVGGRLHELLKPEASPAGLNVCNMESFKSFIANDEGGKGQILRLTATANNTDNAAKLVFSSISGKTEVQHAKCDVEFGSTEAWLAEWQRSAYLISGRIQNLKQAANTGNAHLMLRGMAYKLFGAFVDYNKSYRGMESVILDSPELEATAKIAFQTTDADGSFVCSPHWIDSSCHLAGFIVNANDAIDSTQQVFISHGWESMRFAEPLRRDKTYRSYVKMQPLPDNMIAGDVYIFDGDRIIGMCGALKFKSIPRSVLNLLLPPKGTSMAKKAPAKTSLPAPIRISAKALNSKPSKASLPKPVAASKPRTSVVARALEIIAAEVGMPLVELADPIDFSTIGVDSLMSLTITGRFREELDIDDQSTLFVDYPTVGALKGYLDRYNSIAIQSTSDFGDSDSSGTPSETDGSSIELEDVGTPLSPPGTPGEPSDMGALSMIIRQTIAEQMEIDMDELLATEDLTAIGMDSLMALSIMGLFRERAGLDLSSDFLVDNVNIKAIEKALQIDTPRPTAPPKSSAKIPKASDFESNPAPAVKTSSPSPPITQLPVAETTVVPSRLKRSAPPDRKASSVLLQGNSKTAEKTLFLVPDGGGAPMSYSFIEPISPSLAIWGLTSPFVKTPEEFICGVVGIATIYVAEIKRRQPTGPYHIGGWSAGGVISFETCRQLMSQGEEVATLLLIDTPCPLIIEPLPSSLHRFFGSIGLLGDGEGALEKLPPWLLPHFAASVHALSTYDPVPLTPTAKCPKVWAMWCEDGVCKTPEDPRPDPYPYGHAQFLLENRTDFGPNLWDEFVDTDKLVTRHMPGNHFSMMKAPFVKHLSEFMREAMA